MPQVPAVNSSVSGEASASDGPHGHGLSPDESAVPVTDIASSVQTVTDYEAMMQANLVRVFGEHNPSRRITAIRELYDRDAVLHEPDHSARGHDAIGQAVTALLAHLPPEFVFSAIRPATGHNGVGRLQWRAGPPGGPAAVTGTDVAHIESGLIRSLHVFLDLTDA